MTDKDTDFESQLTNLQTIIQQQRSQIDLLLSQRQEPSASDEIKQAILETASFAIISASSSYVDALEAIVATAADVLDATAAALFLVDEKNEQLIFAVALGSKSDEVKELSVPIGQGIAGYVASTGQAISITDVEQDSRFYRSIGESIGYIPNSIICVPLILKDSVIGVLELMDKANGESFSVSDMETLGQFGNLAAHTIEESKLTHDMRYLFHQLLNGESKRFDNLDTSVDKIETALGIDTNSDSIKMAELVHELCQDGDASRKLALDILNNLVNYINAKSNS
jgi:signal transduction protein with GAF and PtsI domain